MKVLHVPYCYFPDPVGGTEVYVHALAREQKAIGIDAEIAAPSGSNNSYEYSGVFVRRFAISRELNLPQVYGEGDPVAAGSFEVFALAGKPDLVHLHSYTAAVSRLLLHCLKARGIPVVFTFHTPAVSCVRGDLLYRGEGICNGEMRDRDCTICKLQSLGVPPDIGECLARVPPALARQAAYASSLLGKNLATVLEMGRLVEIRNRYTLEFLSGVDRIVAVCDWVRQVLLRNGVNPEKIVTSRQGLTQRVSEVRPGRHIPDRPLRLVYFGRLHNGKGVELLAEAVLKAEAEVTLDVYGTVQDHEGEIIRSRLSVLEARSPRIRVRPPVHTKEVVSILARYHLLAAPSQLMETGPLVIYEAFAAGIPVLGSNIGGIAELVNNGKNGFLVKHDAIGAWIRAIEFLAQNPPVVNRLAANVMSPRSMAEAAQDMNPVYASLVPCETFSLQG
jgi:glycosyltransferase involved in cell wall biosynthesis